MSRAESEQADFSLHFATHRKAYFSQILARFASPMAPESEKIQAKLGLEALLFPTPGLALFFVVFVLLCLHIFTILFFAESAFGYGIYDVFFASILGGGSSSR